MRCDRIVIINSSTGDEPDRVRSYLEQKYQGLTAAHGRAACASVPSKGDPGQIVDGILSGSPPDGGSSTIGVYVIAHGTTGGFAVLGEDFRVAHLLAILAERGGAQNVKLRKVCLLSCHAAAVTSNQSDGFTSTLHKICSLISDQVGDKRAIDGLMIAGYNSVFTVDHDGNRSISPNLAKPRPPMSKEAKKLVRDVQAKLDRGDRISHADRGRFGSNQLKESFQSYATIKIAYKYLAQQHYWTKIDIFQFSDRTALQHYAPQGEPDFEGVSGFGGGLPAPRQLSDDEDGFGGLPTPPGVFPMPGADAFTAAVREGDPEL